MGRGCLFCIIRQYLTKTCRIDWYNRCLFTSLTRPDCLHCRLTRLVDKIMLSSIGFGVISMDEILPRKTEKPWGYELLYALTPQYAGKILFVKKGFRLSLQYHQEKDESMYLLQGKVLFTIQPQNGKLTEIVGESGFCLHLPPMTTHRIEALEDATLLEVSTPQLGDVVRLQDDYGRSK